MQAGGDHQGGRQEALPAGEDAEDVSLDLDMSPPPDHVMDYARVHLHECPDTRAAALQDLRDMVYERGEVTPHRTDDDFLIRFLRTRRFDVEKAHLLMVNYYSFKESNPELHEGVRPLQFNYIGDDNVINALPYREQTGRRVLIYRIGNWRTGSYSANELLKASVLLMELAVLEQCTQVLGSVCVFDMAAVSLYHAWNVSSSVAGKIVQLLVTSFPMRMHAIHIVNQSWVFDIIFAIFRPMLNERMRKKIFFHWDDLESLHAHIHPKYLPERYGGTRPEYSYTHWFESLTSNPKVVSEMESLGYIIVPEEAKQNKEHVNESQPTTR